MNGNRYEPAAFRGDKLPADIVMKGGITSGVVYPLAIVELARKYRFASVGGTSAGALAAAITAAAEYGREKDGFVRVLNIPEYISKNLLSFFQPVPKLRPLFSILISLVSRRCLTQKIRAAIFSALVGHPISTFLGLALGIMLFIWGAISGEWGWVTLGVFLSVIGAAAALSVRIALAVLRELPANRFGMCTGLTQPGYMTPALTNWLTDEIDRVAGRECGPTDPPLTFGDLIGSDPSKPKITLAVMTTNLSSRRPYRLPFRTRQFLFRKSEFASLFPTRVVKHMVEKSEAFPKNKPQLEDYYYFPRPENVPIVVAARMSLSFPGLISAIPLYSRDFTLIGEKKDTPQLCWFSDGGLSSNFPIHFFDQLWPNVPTFAIALEEHKQDRHGDKRVHMADSPQSGILIPIREIRTLGKFVMSLLDAAKDWQDNLQSTLPGYRERIVRVALKEEEGGLNLTMPPEIISALTNLGAEAGELAATEFDLQEHRWRRFLVAMARIEETLDELLRSYDGEPGNTESFSTFLDTYPAQPKNYKQTRKDLEELLKRAKELVVFARDWQREPRIGDCTIPKPEAVMRITPQE